MQDALWEKGITIRKKNDTIREKDISIREKEDIIREKEDIIRAKEYNLRELEDVIRQNQDIIRRKEDTIRENEDSIREMEDIIRQKENIIWEKDDAIRKKENDFREKEDLIWKMENGLREKEDAITEKEKVLINVNNEMVRLKDENKELKTQVQTMKSSMNEKEAEIKNLIDAIFKHKDDIGRANSKVKQLEEDVKKRDNEIKCLNEGHKILEANNKIQQLKQDLEKKENETKSCNEARKVLNGNVKKLEQTKGKLNEILNDKMKTICIQQDKIDDLKWKLSASTKQFDKMIKELQKQEEKMTKDLLKEEEGHKKDIEVKNKLQDENEKLKKEITRVSLFEQAYNRIPKKITDAAQEINKLQNTIQSQLSTIKRQENEIDWFRIKNESKQQTIIILEDELSKIQDAQLTVSNPNIADLSDDKRPTKLAEEFSELYDNEWTDAFECIEAENDDEKTQVLYDLLKRSYEFCETLSTSHAEAIRKSFTTLNYTKKLHKQNTDDKSSNMLSGRPDRTDEVYELAKGNDDMNQTVQNYRQSSFKNTARSRPQNGKQYKKKEVPDDTKVLLIAEGDCAKKRNDVTDVTISELIFNFDDFNTEQKKTLLDLRKLCEEKQANDVVQVGSKLIATEMQIENGEVMEYISKCIDICWSMCRHTPPVYINYSKSEEGLPFDKQKYRPYTKSGKFVHFVVWPVLYLHEGGPQLSKGVAQGKD